MEKRSVNMQDWELHIYDDRYNLSGNADDHPKLGKRAYVRHTSRLVDYRFEDDILIYETRNTIYCCPLKHMSSRPYRGVSDEYKCQLINRVNDKSNILDRIIAVTALISIRNNDDNLESENECRKEGCTEDELFAHITTLQIEGQREIAEAENNLKEHLISVTKNYEDCIYIEMSNISTGDTLAYNISGCTGIIEPYIHIGMVQDSVLYTQYQEEEDVPDIDFRYFPKGSDAMETYDWSDNILNVVIKNDCTFSMRFNGENIQMGETRKFTRKKHQQRSDD